MNVRIRAPVAVGALDDGDRAVLAARKQLAKKFGISRTALLPYDAIGLLKPQGRARNRYRQYSPDDEKRSGLICRRRAGRSVTNA